jgi:hypothetical protein
LIIITFGPGIACCGLAHLCGHGLRRRQVRDAWRGHHAEALLRLAHDARRCFQLGHVEPEPLVLRLRVSDARLKPVEVGLAAGEHRVEGSEREQRGHHHDADEEQQRPHTATPTGDGDPRVVDDAEVGARGSIATGTPRRLGSATPVRRGVPDRRRLPRGGVGSKTAGA